MNESFTQPLVLTAIGGRRGGGAQVTAFGRKVVREYHRMEDKASGAIARDLRQFLRNLRQTGKIRSSKR